MGQNEHLSVFTNISEDEGHVKISISNLAPDLGPDFNNQFRIVILSVILLMSTVGNTLVLQKICSSFTNTVSRPNILFLNLTLADVLCTFFCIAGELMWTIVDREWRYGDTMCKLFKFFQTFGLTSSTYLVVAIALDRLWAIVTPLSRHSSAGRLCLLTWLLAILPCLPCLALFDDKVYDEKHMCVSKFYSEKEVYTQERRQIYFFIVLTCVYIIPFLLTISFYISILNTLFRQFFKLRNTDTTTDRVVIIDEQRNLPPADVEGDNGDPVDQAEGLRGEHQQSSNGQASHRGLIPRARVKVFNLSLAYAITFLASNVPYVTFELIIALDKQDNMGPIMAALFGILPTLNSALNPFMYLMFNSQLYCMQVFTTECCPLTSLLFKRLSAFTHRIPSPPGNHSHSNNTNNSFHLHRINPELIGAPVHVSNSYQHEIIYNQDEIQALNTD